MWLCVSFLFVLLVCFICQNFFCLNDQAYNCLIHFYSKLIWRHDIWRHEILRHEIWHHKIWCHKIWHHEILRHEIWRHEILRHEIWRHEIGRHEIWRHKIRHHKIWHHALWGHKYDVMKYDVMKYDIKIKILFWQGSIYISMYINSLNLKTALKHHAINHAWWPNSTYE